MLSRVVLKRNVCSISIVQRIQGSNFISIDQAKLLHFPESFKIDFSALKSKLLCTILATPSFLPLLERSNHYTGSLLGNLHQNGAQYSQLEVDVLLAGVDRIPLPAALLPSGGASTGLEGLSIRLSDSDLTAPDLWQSSGGTSGSDEHVPAGGTLTFLLKPHRATSADAQATSTQPTHTTHVVHLPLANTVFVNGRPWTLRAQKWKMEAGDGTAEPRLQCTAERELSRQQIYMQGLRESARFVPGFGRSETLTPPRVVTECVGNVIRAFQGPDGRPLAASEELEAAVAQRLAREAETGARCEVWASVAPRERGYDEAPVGFSLGDGILRGTRVCRVTGGGGGWGSKRGLLSLEPDETYEEATPERDALGPYRFESPAREGDVVSFFGLWYPKEPTSAAPERLANRTIVLEGGHVDTIGLGSSGPLSEQLTASGDAKGAAGSDDPIYLRGHFGALSERGASLRICRSGPDDRPRQTAFSTSKVPPFCSIEWSPIMP